MGRRKPKIFSQITLSDVADRGKAVGKTEDGRVIFVSGGVPGDVVDILVTKKKKGHMIGRVIERHQDSPDRQEAFCEHFGLCGGCKWQDLKYEAQLKYKQQTVENAIKRLGKVEPKSWLPILGSAETRFYRNKLDFSFSNRRWLTQEEVDSGDQFERNAVGFHPPGFFDKVIDVNKCFLQADPSNNIRNHIRNLAIQNNWTFYDVKRHHGLLRNLIIRTSSINELMLIVCFGEDKPEARHELLEDLKKTFPQITSLNYVVNTKMNDTIYDQDVICYDGKPFLLERLGDVEYMVGPKSFFQTNTRQANMLYQVTADFAELKGHENVYDLYTGIGSIACFVAKHCEHVTGIEEIEPAIQDAKKNAAHNGLENTTFYAGDVKDILDADFVERHGKPDLIITDPPRAGMHPDVVKTLLAVEAPVIVYVSCNPATQARDIQLLSEKYDLVKSQAVDMFPHTHHIENVVRLERKS